MKWWEKPVRMMRLDYGPDLQRMRDCDLDQLARSKKEEWHINCEWVIGTPGVAPGLGHQTTFNTPLFSKYPALGNWDLIRSYLPYARKYGIHVLAYLNLHWYAYDFGEEKASWQQRIEDGRTRGEIAPLYGSGTTFCVNTPWKEWAYDLIREAMKTGIEGVFLDGPGLFPGCCYCDACKEKFRERTGHALPSFEDWADELWKEFIFFREDSMADFLQGAQEAMHEINPEGVIFLNAGSWHGGGWRVARNMEKVGAYQNFNGAESFFHPGPSAQFPIPWTITAKHLMAGGKPASHHTLGPWHYIPLPEIEERLSIAQTVANGANPWFAVFDYALDHSREEAIRPVKELNSFLEKNEEYYTSTESAAKVAVLYSTQSSVFYLSREEGIYTVGGSGEEQNLVADIRKAHIATMKKRKQLCDEMQNRDFWGACYLLTRGHIPYDVILDNQLTDQALARYKVLVLPNSACLTDKQVLAIKRFVSRGGGLVADFETGRYDATGRLRADHPMANLFGISIVEGAMEPVPFEEYVKVKAQHEVTKSFGNQQLLARPLYCLKVQPQAGNEKDAEKASLATPLVFMNSTGSFYSVLKGESPYPAIIVREYGEGRVVYFPHLLSDMYTRYKIQEHEKLYINSILWAYKDMQPIEVIGPPTVELEVRKQVYPDKGGERFLVHLINNTGDMQRPISELVPIKEVKIYLRGFRPEKIYSLSSGKSIQFDRIEGCNEDGVVYSVTASKLNIYEVIVVEVFP